MYLSVIICTYRRADDLLRLLDCLAAQTYTDAELLVIDGSGTDSTVRDRLAAWVRGHDLRLTLRLIVSAKSLTHQRNVGLQHAQGEVVCFLDDDVTVGDDFLARVAAIFEQLGTADIGGICGYDVLHYPQPVTMAWHVRNLLGITPRLEPGAVDHLGRYAPLFFARPDAGQLAVGWLHGCMIYRRTAIVGLRFDELLPTYGAEDKDFALSIALPWRLMLCCDLPLEHHLSSTSRDDAVQRSFQYGFGIGRSFAKRRQHWRDTLTIAHYLCGEVLFHALGYLCMPSWVNARKIMVVPAGIVAGLYSWQPHHPPDGRTWAQIEAHYRIERALADQLRSSAKHERQYLYNRLYDELYQRVPDHPQLINQAVQAQVRRAIVQADARFLKRFLTPQAVFLEVGAGDGQLAYALAPHARHIYAVEVSETVAQIGQVSANIEWVISDGCTIPVPPDSVHLAYSDQLMEHLHPDDVLDHLRHIYCALVPGGVYICKTPSRLSGPHDVSYYFDNVATGFHLKEYTTTELYHIFRAVGFSKVQTYLYARGLLLIMPIQPVLWIEAVLAQLPRAWSSAIARNLPIRAVLSRVLARKGH